MTSSILRLPSCTGTSLRDRFLPAAAARGHPSCRERIYAAAYGILCLGNAAYNGTVCLCKTAVCVLSFNLPGLCGFSECQRQARATMKAAIVALPFILSPVLPAPAWLLCLNAMDHFLLDGPGLALRLKRHALAEADEFEEILELALRILQLVRGTPEEGRLRCKVAKKLLRRCEDGLEGCVEEVAFLAIKGVLAEVWDQGLQEQVRELQRGFAELFPDLEAPELLDEAPATRTWRERLRCIGKGLLKPKVAPMEAPEPVRERRDRKRVNTSYLVSKSYAEYLAGAIQLAADHGCASKAYYGPGIAGLVPDYFQTLEGIFVLQLAHKESGARRRQLIEAGLLALSRGVLNGLSDVTGIGAMYSNGELAKQVWSSTSNISSAITDLLGLYKNLWRDVPAHWKAAGRAKEFERRLRGADLEWPEGLQQLNEELLHVLERQQTTGYQRALAFFWVAMSRFGFLYAATKATVVILEEGINDACFPTGQEVALFCGRLGWALGGMARIRLTAGNFLTQVRNKRLRANLATPAARRVTQAFFAKLSTLDTEPDACTKRLLSGRDFGILSLGPELQVVRGDPISVSRALQRLADNDLEPAQGSIETMGLDSEQLFSELSARICV